MSGHSEILERLKALEKKFGTPRLPVDLSDYEYQFRRYKYTQIVGMVKEQLKLDMRLTVGYVKRGGKPNAPAWIVMPDPMPPYGTAAFRRSVMVMYVKREHVLSNSCKAFVRTVAHELAHVVLGSTGHALPHDEKLVDLAAMYLGYHHVFPEGSRLTAQQNILISRRVVRWRWFLRREVTYEVVPATPTLRGRLGYLSEDEIEFAHAYISSKIKKGPA